MNINILTKIVICFLLFVLPSSVGGSERFDALKAEYDTLTANSPRMAYTTLGDRFFRLYAGAPGGRDADQSLLYAGRAYKRSHELYKNAGDGELAVKYLRIVSTNYTTDAAAEAYLDLADIYTSKNDLASAQFTLNRLKNRFPNTPYETKADQKLLHVEAQAKRPNRPTNTGTPLVIPPEVINNPPVVVSTPPPPPVTTVVAVNPEPAIPIPDDMAVDTDLIIPDDEPTPGGKTLVRDIRYFSDRDYTRIVIDLSQAAKIEKHWLRENKELKLPPRLFIEIENSEVLPNVPRMISIKDGLVQSVRWGYNKPGVTRIVLDSQAIKDFTVFQMGNPYRIVIDVSNDTRVASSQPPAPSAHPPAGVTRTPTGTRPAMPTDQTLADALGLRIQTIVIDPGHGGRDPGAVAHGMHEKDIVLDIALHLRDLLRANNKDLTVHLTRDKDVFIPLEERTAIANKHRADLFISIHVNATRSGQASGVETYVLNVTNDKAALAVAAFENQATTKSLSDLHGILRDIMLNSKLEESLLLAGATQRGLVSMLKLSKAQDLGVKQAPFYVLMGAMMPSILVEVGFLTNKDDAKKLASPAYRKEAARGIYAGIDEYIKKYNK